MICFTILKIEIKIVNDKLQVVFFWGEGGGGFNSTQGPRFVNISDVVAQFCKTTLKE